MLAFGIRCVRGFLGESIACKDGARHTVLTGGRHTVTADTELGPVEPASEEPKEPGSPGRKWMIFLGCLIVVFVVLGLRHRLGRGGTRRRYGSIGHGLAGRYSPGGGFGIPGAATSGVADCDKRLRRRTRACFQARPAPLSRVHWPSVRSPPSGLRGCRTATTRALRLGPSVTVRSRGPGRGT